MVECIDRQGENSKNDRMHYDAGSSIVVKRLLAMVMHWLWVQCPVDLTFSISTEPLTKTFILR